MNEKFFWISLVIRFFNGIVMGSSTTVSGCYTVEISPPDVMGIYGVFNSIMISFGHCTFNLIGAIHNWRVNVYVAGGLFLLQFLFGFFLPNSPVDIDKKKTEKSKDEIFEDNDSEKEKSKEEDDSKDAKFKDKNDYKNEKFEDINDSKDKKFKNDSEDDKFKNDSEDNKFKNDSEDDKFKNDSEDDKFEVEKFENDSEIDVKKRSLFQKCYVKPMIIGIALHVFQQFSGVNALVSNMSPILNQGGLSIDSAYQAAITTCSELFAGLISTVLMDKLGRRVIWIISSCGTCVSMALFATNLVNDWSSVIPIVSIFLYMFLFGGGLAPIPWIIVPEMFDDDVRSTANSICVSLNWLSASVVTFCFPYMEKSMKMYGSFYFFSACSLCALIFGIIFIPSDPKIYRMHDDDSICQNIDDCEEKYDASEINEI